jgi:hypothetical protein
MFIDARCGDELRYYWSRPKDWNMRISEELRASAISLATVLSVGSRERLCYQGSGFIVGVPSAAIPGIAYRYLVTAKHVADRLLLGGWVVRLNTKDGRSITCRGTKEDKWWFHPTESSSVDVAVSYGNVLHEADVWHISERMFVTDERIAKHGIGLGDEVYMIGLFSPIPGKEKNTPIVRFGNLSLIPAPGEGLPEVDLDGKGALAEIYVVEARSIGGLSGSAAYVRTTVSVDVPVQDNVEGAGEIRAMRCLLPGTSFLLGLVRGHWDILPEEKDEMEPRFVGRNHPNRVNVGLAIVIPAKKIREVLYQQELVEERNANDQAYLREHGTTTLD